MDWDYFTAGVLIGALMMTIYLITEFRGRNN